MKKRTTYKIVDNEGRIIDTFRGKHVALKTLKYLKRNYFDMEFKLIEMKGGKS